MEPKDPENNLNVQQKNIMVYCHNGKLYSNENEALLHDTKMNFTKGDTQKIQCI